MWLRRAVLLILAIPGVFTAGAVWSMVREAATHVPAIAESETIRAVVPPGGSVDIVMLTPRAREQAVFFGAELMPRDVRFFNGWDAWRARRRATFMNDARAVNAPPGPPPGPATLVLECGSDGIRIVAPR